MNPQHRVAVVVALLAAAVGAVLRGSAGHIAGGIAVGVIVAVPLLRVLALAVHWLRAGDVRFAMVAIGLLTVVATSAVIAAW
jgi:hypothetical protein